MKRAINNWKFVIIACLTLGLAPYIPEPHFLGKVRWVMGGGVGMKFMDWFDLIYHGLPWFLLVRLIFVKIKEAAAKRRVQAISEEGLAEKS